MKVINMFAGPGAGKSTTAAGLFHKMKRLSLNVELVTEYAKEVVWENSLEKLNDQLYIFAKQNRRINRLSTKVDYIITDSPLLLVQYYGRRYSAGYSETLNTLVLETFNKYDNLNFYIDRTKKYSAVGRLGGYDSAIEADIGIKKLLDDNSIPYISIRDSHTIVDEIIEEVL